MEHNHVYPAQAISQVRIKLTWAQLELDATKASDFQLIVAGDDESVEELRVEQTGDGLTIGQPQLAYAMEILPRRRWLQICLRIPEAWRGELDANTVAGTVSARKFAGTDVSLTTVSGSMNVRDMQADILWLHTVSGAVSGKNLTAKRCNLRGVSGQMKLTEVAFEKTKVFTVGGSVELSMLPGARSLDGQSVSGSLCVETDGPVKAALHSLSGQFLLDDSFKQQNEGMEISVSSVSGDLAVRKREGTVS